VAVLKAEPAGPVRSLGELFALAHAIESDALDRYSEIAEQLHKRDSRGIAQVFDQLTEIQRRRVSDLASLAYRGKSQPINERIASLLPTTFDAPPKEVAQSKLLTRYRALASAVRREERTFAFWSYVSAHAERNDVKQAAEHMALEALERVSSLRRERRRAFHAQRGTSGPMQITVDAAALASKERCIAEIIKQSSALHQDGDLAQVLATASREAASKLDELEETHHPRLSLPKVPANLERDPLAISELLVEAYLALAESAKDATVVGAAQDLAGAAIYRLAALRSALEIDMRNSREGS
jgi:rubrerythrin